MAVALQSFLSDTLDIALRTLRDAFQRSSGPVERPSQTSQPCDRCSNAQPAGLYRHHHKRKQPMWTKPTYTDLRIGFEVTMYFASR